MKKFVFVIVIISIFGCSNKNKNGNPENKVIIGYIHAGNQLINWNDIDAEKMTHINFAFANIVDGEIADGSKTDSANYIILNKLKTKNPDLKILVSVGGWSWSDGFSDMANSKESRAKFIESAVKYIKKHKIDGIDLDWEYPGLPGEGNPYKPEDKQNFTFLLQELREGLKSLKNDHKSHYILTIAAAAFKDYVTNIEAEKIFPILDYINLMSYDFSGEWDTITGHLTNLYQPELMEDASSCKKTIELYKNAGVPAEKLVLGMAFYGRGWKNVKSVNHGLFQNGNGYNPGYSFNSINENFLNKNGFIRYFDSVTKAPYIYNADSLIFITYEDTESIKYKCELIKKEHLAGAMFWEYNDDYKGELLNAINVGLKKVNNEDLPD